MFTKKAGDTPKTGKQTIREAPKHKPGEPFEDRCGVEPLKKQSGSDDEQNTGRLSGGPSYIGSDVSGNRRRTAD